MSVLHVGFILLAFAELGWGVTYPGSPASLRYVIFRCFVSEDEAWRISDIRVLR